MNSWRRGPVHESGPASGDGGPGASEVADRAAVRIAGVSRSSLYYRPKGASEADLCLMGEMDRQYLETSFYGSRRMKAWLERQRIPVSRKRVQRLMRVMGLRAIYRRPRTSEPVPEHRVYPYLVDSPVMTGLLLRLLPSPIFGYVALQR